MRYLILCYKIVNGETKLVERKYFDGFGKAIGYMLSEECRQNYDSATYVHL